MAKTNDSNLKLPELFAKNEKWNQYTILERGRRMVHFLETMVSGLKFSDEEIMALLFVKEDYYVKES